MLTIYVIVRIEQEDNWIPGEFRREGAYMNINKFTQKSMEAVQIDGKRVRE